MKSIEASGSFLRVGENVGEAAREDVRFICDSVAAHLAAHTSLKTREALRAAIEPFYRASERFFPEAFEYLRGMAAGANANFDGILLAMFDEEISEAFEEKCSTLAALTPRGWIVGHNEDYGPHYDGRLSLLDLSIDGWPRLLAVSYPGKLPGVGGTLNARGLSVTNNSLTAAVMAGISSEARGFRAALASDAEEAVTALSTQPAALTAHFTILSAAGRRAISLEVGNAASSKELSVRSDLKAPAAHTNTVLNLPLAVPDGSSANSRDRYEKLKRIIAAGAPADPESMMALFSNYDGLLNRRPGDHPTSITLATVVIRAETGELWVRDYGTTGAETKKFQI